MKLLFEDNDGNIHEIATGLENSYIHQIIPFIAEDIKRLVKERTAKCVQCGEPIRYGFMETSDDSYCKSCSHSLDNDPF